MAQSRAQLVSPIGNVDVNGGIIVSGVTTAGTFSGNFTGTATGLSGTPNLNVGVITATSYVGDGSNLTGIAATPFVGQNVTSQSGTTTIDLSQGNVIYFTHNTDTTVAFANTSTVQSLTFIRTKDDTTTARNLTWPSSVLWNNGTTPLLLNNQRSTDAQQFNLLTRDSGVTWYGHEEVNYNIGDSLWSWGYNNLGSLGQNDTTRRSSPVQIPGTNWNSIAGGSQWFLASKTDGTLWSWGSNSNGHLGQNNTTNISSPVQIPGTTWSSVGGGSLFSLATKTDGTLWAWGRNAQGQLGQSTSGSYASHSSPVQIPGTTWSSNIIKNPNASHVLATKTDGTLWAWGFGTFGRLGQNATTSQSSPVQILGTSWSSVGNTYDASATKTDGTLWMWGRNIRGQLGQNNTTTYSSPVQIPGTTWSSIAGGEQHTLATKTDGTLWSWGYNAKGQLGQNNRTDYSSPVQIPGTAWSSIGGGGDISAATKTNGTLWMFGTNIGGQLGQNSGGSYQGFSSPVQVPGTSWNFAVGNTSTLATKSSS